MLACAFELACGTGSTAIAHSPYVKRIVAIDISSRMLEIAQGKADAGNIGNITFKQSTLEDFEAIPETFDVAMAHSILHLIEDPEAASKTIYKMLKPGGVFVTSTFCLASCNTNSTIYSCCSLCQYLKKIGIGAMYQECWFRNRRPVSTKQEGSSLYYCSEACE